MFRNFIVLTALFATSLCMNAQETIYELMPVRGFSISAPKPQELDEFDTFIEDDLSTRKINVLIMRVDSNYQYQTQPE